MNANTLTVIVGIAGIVASYLLYLVGARKARTENGRLHQEIADTRSVLASYVFARSNSSDKKAVTSPASSATDLLPDTAIEELLRASLGALVNERGDVDVTRLMREVAAVVGPSHIADALATIRRMRDQGVVWWDGGGDDLSGVRTLHVRVVRSAGDEDISNIGTG
jgi:hypothetical protein